MTKTRNSEKRKRKRRVMRTLKALGTYSVAAPVLSIPYQMALNRGRVTPAAILGNMAFFGSLIAAGEAYHHGGPIKAIKSYMPKNKR